MGSAVPTDRFYLAYCFLILHGIGFLLPWNVFINAREYFVDYKLNTTISHEADYRINFMSYLGFAAHFPSLCFAAWNTFFQKNSRQSNTVFRFMVAMIIEVTVLLFTVAMTMIDTSHCPGVFFVLTIISVVFINCCVGIHQTLTFGMAAVLPMKYSNAVIVGSNACGTIISLVNILTKWLAATQGHSPRTVVLAAIAYFLSAITIVLACVTTFFWLRRLKFVRYHSDPRYKHCFEVFPANENGSNESGTGNGIEKCDLRKGSSTSTSLPDVEIQTPDKSDAGSTAVNMTELNTDTGTPDCTVPIVNVEKMETDALIRTADPTAANSLLASTESDGVLVLRDCLGVCCFSWPDGIHRCRAYWSRYITCFQECWPHCLSVWSVFFCSLSAFPAIQSMVQPVDPNYFIALSGFHGCWWAFGGYEVCISVNRRRINLWVYRMVLFLTLIYITKLFALFAHVFPVSPRWFVDVTCFFFFNLFAMLGCIVCNWIQFPQPRFLWIPVWIRTIFFIPFFLFCNFNLPDPKLPVLIGNDHVYLFAAIVFAFTNGYFSSLAMMYAPKSCTPERAEMAGMLAAFFLILGVCSGVYTSRGLLSLIL